MLRPPVRTTSARFALSLSSWFCVPEQGMKDMEILCRGSAFLVRSQSSSFRHKYHVLTASHVVAPWRFPKYYPDEWLQFVNEKHTHYTVELRHDDGVFMTQSELLPAAIHHVNRDMATLHFDNESVVTDLMEAVGISIADLHHSSNAPLTPGELVEFHGHEVEMPSSFGGGDTTTAADAPVSDDNKRPIPRTVRGSFHLQTPRQTFIKTSPTVLTYGMCGGPCLLRTTPTSPTHNNSNNNNNNNSKTVDAVICGLLEGIIPVDHPEVALRGLGSIVDNATILGFLRDIEGGVDRMTTQGHVLLQGGEAALAVGRDQDPDKIGWENLTRNIDS